MSTGSPQAYDPAFVADITSVIKTLRGILANVGSQIIGQEILRRRLIEALLVNGHVLIEGVPGLAKTLSIKALAGSVDGSFRRIQFTPDLLPADLLGTEIFRPQDGTFAVRQGPVFANFVLADEINRAPAKVQSALLETMQEFQVTIGERSYPVPRPYFVLATQNPIEQEGTYPLPEAQIDRFCMKVKITYPSIEEERDILDTLATGGTTEMQINPVASLKDIEKASSLCKRIYIDGRIRDYIVNLVWASRDPKKFGLGISQLIELGASPRASISLLQLARAEALLEGEHFVVPQNVKDVALDVLRHRIVPSYEAEAQGLTSDNLVQMILEAVEVP